MPLNFVRILLIEFVTWVFSAIWSLRQWFSYFILDFDFWLFQFVHTLDFWLRSSGFVHATPWLAITIALTWNCSCSLVNFCFDLCTAVRKKINFGQRVHSCSIFDLFETCILILYFTVFIRLHFYYHWSFGTALVIDLRTLLYFAYIIWCCYLEYLCALLLSYICFCTEPCSLL